MFGLDLFTDLVQDHTTDSDFQKTRIRNVLAQLDSSLNSNYTHEEINLKLIDAKISRHRKKYSKIPEYTLDQQNSGLSGNIDEEQSLVTPSNVSIRSSDPLLVGVNINEKKPTKQPQTVNQLLMTNGEIDINKILCLHTVTLCEPGITKFPKRDINQHSDRLVTRYANLLPNYLLSAKTICRCKGKCKCNDMSQPKKMPISVNSQIEMILNTALQVLARLNKAKLQILIALSHNPVYLKQLLSDDAFKQHINVINDSGVMNEQNYGNTDYLTVLKADPVLLSKQVSKNDLVFKILLPHHFPVFQIPVFSLRTSAGALIGDPDESVPVLLNLYKQVTMGKKINDEEMGLSVLPDFSNTRLAIISDDGSDFALISKSGNIVKPSSVQLTQNLVNLVENTNRQKKGKTGLEADEDLYPMVNYNPRPKFSKNPVVMMDSLIGLAKENLGLAEKPPKMKMGISEVQRRRMESEQLRCSILRRLSNTDRMLLAKEAARRTENHKEMLRKSSKSKLEMFSTLMSSVMSKRSILSLARNSSKKEREFMFKPINKGGLGFGDLILEQNVLSQMEGNTKSSTLKYKTSLTPSLPHIESLPTLFNKSTFNLETNQVRNEIIAAELKEKVKNFVSQDMGLMFTRLPKAMKKMKV